MNKDDKGQPQQGGQSNKPGQQGRQPVRTRGSQVRNRRSRRSNSEKPDQSAGKS
jgi:hypothetical protein